MGRGVLFVQVGVCWLMMAVCLGGCTGRWGRETAAVRPLETQSRPDWRPTATEPDYLALARDLIRQHHYTVALRQLDLAIQADENAAEAHYLQGVCQRETGDQASARESFQRAIQSDREYAPAYNGLGIVGCMDGQYELARKAMQKAVALNPANPDFLNNLGVVEIRARLVKSALTRFEQCLRIAPDHTRAKNNLAECLVRLGRNQAALAFLEKHFPPAAACNNLGVIHERVGYPSQARGIFRRALEIDPHLAAARHNLNRLDAKEAPQP